MAGSSQQKLKLLYLLKILKEKSDENHPLTASDLVRELESYGISAERKSIYRDIVCFMEFGIDINDGAGKKGYYIGQQDFQVSELKLLVDAILAARFITTGKTSQIINKLLTLTNNYSGSRLKNSICMLHRIKCPSEEIYYYIDEIQRAIDNNKKLSFQYCEYDSTKQRKPRDNGKLYVVNPYSLVWFDANYYLVSNHDCYDNLINYRVDRMYKVTMMDEPRRIISDFFNCNGYLNTAEYTNKLFSMFYGGQESVRIRFANKLINAVIDRFGTEITIIEDSRENFITNVKVSPSDGFLAWLFIFGKDIEIVSPIHLREAYIKRLESISKLYGQKAT